MAAPLTSEVVSEVEALLGFSRPEEVAGDDKSRGLKRAITRAIDTDFSQQFEYQRCKVRDLSAPDSLPLNFVQWALRQ